MYANIDFYNDEYKGIAIPDAEVLGRLLTRASRDIDILTSFNIDLMAMSPKNINLVKLATCAQTEFLAMRGETASSIAQEHGSVSIGSYSESSGGQYGAQSKTPPSRFSASVRELLLPTGLLYGGVMMRGY